MKSNSIVFVHGIYMNPLCWEHWIVNYQDKGYKCLAPAWPARDQPIETLRKNHPDMQLGKLTLSNVLEHFTDIIKTLDEKPILIGHSMGGLVVQLLLQGDLVAAGIAIDSAPPKGVFTTKWPFLKSNWPHITPFVSQKSPIEMTFERFQYTFVNTLPFAEQRAAYDRYVVPESRHVPRESLTARVDFKKPHPPFIISCWFIRQPYPGFSQQDELCQIQTVTFSYRLYGVRGTNSFYRRAEGLGRSCWLYPFLVE